MKLIIFNGSPRYKKSNSALLINQFILGYQQVINDVVPVYYLAKRDKEEDYINAVKEADYILMFFPLYTDCMPGVVKEFIELVYDAGTFQGKKFGFVVQSGFPEGKHSIYVERYLKKLISRLQAEYLGTVIKGGVEGIQIMPPMMTRSLFRSFNELGKFFAETGHFNAGLMEKLRKPYQLSATRIVMLRIMTKLGFANFYWNSNLKKNNAYEIRFSRPLEKV